MFPLGPGVVRGHRRPRRRPRSTFLTMVAWGWYAIPGGYDLGVITVDTVVGGAARHAAVHPGVAALRARRARPGLDPRRGRAHAAERVARPRDDRAGRRAAGLPGAHHRRRGRGAPAAGARPARRRAAAARRALHAARARQAAARQGRGRRRPRRRPPTRRPGRRSTSCATSRAACTRPCSPTAASRRRCATWPRAPPCRSSSASCPRSGCPARSRPPRTSRSPRR